MRKKEGEFLAGYKSYIIGISMVLLGVYLMVQGMDAEGWQMLLMGLAVMGLRKGIAKAEK